MRRVDVCGVMYHGPSTIDGEDIVVIAVPSVNRKTGPLTNVWILRADRPPNHAAKDGSDVSNCGACPHRRQSDGKRSCYVIPFQAPLSIWNKWKRGGYNNVSPADFQGVRMRMGAYGDPAAIPFDVFVAYHDACRDSLGYTHQWNTPIGRDFVGLLMASVDSQAGEDRARREGWGTFRVGLEDGSDQGSANWCHAQRTNDGVQCWNCPSPCDGRRQAIYVRAHGQAAKHVPAERLVRRSLPVAA
jgi:hypothetical protein